MELIIMMEATPVSGQILANPMNKARRADLFISICDRGFARGNGVHKHDEPD
ncbi:hypothetical protein RvVAR031_09400 [Agrobacterium vitis]|nr:hypothetical protein RvVAR031_09400 [Agrobacterium vitis]